jgi:hypothetical protein
MRSYAANGMKVSCMPEEDTLADYEVSHFVILHMPEEVTPFL